MLPLLEKHDNFNKSKPEIELSEVHGRFFGKPSDLISSLKEPRKLRDEKRVGLRILGNLKGLNFKSILKITTCDVCNKNIR